MNNERLFQRRAGVNPIAVAKQRLPLPQLIRLLGDAEHAKHSARCPFHEDKRPSFSLFKGRNDGWFWKCHAGCGQGDGVNYLAVKFNCSVGDAIRRYCELAGIEGGGS